VLPGLVHRLGGFCYLLAAVSALAAIAGIVIGPDWIERISGWSPDGRSGALESASVVLPLLGATILAAAGHALRRFAASSRRSSTALERR
jgi:hypothetical protein